MLTAKINIIFH